MRLVTAKICAVPLFFPPQKFKSPLPFYFKCLASQGHNHYVIRRLFIMRVYKLLLSLPVLRVSLAERRRILIVKHNQQ